MAAADVGASSVGAYVLTEVEVFIAFMNFATGCPVWIQYKANGAFTSVGADIVDACLLTGIGSSQVTLIVIITCLAITVEGVASVAAACVIANSVYAVMLAQISPQRAFIHINTCESISTETIPWATTACVGSIGVLTVMSAEGSAQCTLINILAVEVINGEGISRIACASVRAIVVDTNLFTEV